MKLNKYHHIFPYRIISGGFIFWWIVSLVSVLLFDIFWMMQSTFRPMSSFNFWVVTCLQASMLSIPSLFFKNGVLQSICLLFFDLLFLANLMYFRTYYSAIPLHSYTLAGNLSDFSASVADSFKWYFIFLPLLTFLSFIFYYFNNRISKRLPSIPAFLVTCMILILMIFISDWSYGGTMNRMKDLSSSSNLKNAVVPMYSLAGFLTYDYLKSNEKLSAHSLQETKEWLEYHDKISAGYFNDSVRLLRRVPKNLVYILCESLESWPLEKTVEGKEITPNLNSWISDSTSFFAPNVITQVGAGRSIDGQLVLLTGMLPMQNKVYAYEAIDNKYFALPEAMKQKGARTILFSCDKPYVWNQKRVSEAFGWETLVHNGDFINDDPVGIFHLLSDGSLMKQTTNKLQNGYWKENEKAMIGIVTFSGHNPFVLPEHLRSISFSGSYPEVIKNYMTTAHYTDSSLKIIIDYLKSRSDWEETMVVITGDHEGLAIDRSNAVKNPASGEFVDSLQHTPLIILNSPIAGRYEGELGQIDVYTTVLDLMNLNEYPWKGLGQSIFMPEFPSVAINSSGEIIGNTEKIDPTLKKHIKNTKETSDRILKFNLLQYYPDSISNN